MSLTKFTGATNWIRSLINKPIKPASELKEDFDKAGDLIKTYLNNTLTSELDTAINGINTTLGLKANCSDVYTKGNFAIITGSFIDSEDHTVKYDDDTSKNYIDYPSGFNKDNCVIISLSCYNMFNSEFGDAGWYYFNVNANTSEDMFPFRIIMQDNYIELNPKGSSIMHYFTYEKIRMVLMKIS